MPRFAAVTVGLALATILPASASAADSVFWTSYGPPSSISWVALDGSVGGNLATPGVTTSYPGGVAIDAAAGRVYWANTGMNKSTGTIAWAKLDGSGGGTLIPTGPGVTNPLGVAIDPAAKRIYWADIEANRIGAANLDGSGPAYLTTTGATVSNPSGVAIDPAAGRIYWANNVGNKISWANVNGNGGGDLNTAGATTNAPAGVAVDPAAGRIYWANNAGGKISWANLNGAGGGDLNTNGATVSNANGVAIDAAAGRVYWGNQGAGKISYARLDGSGGADVATLTATAKGSQYPALLQRPAGTAAPTIAGATAVGSTLTCSDGAWAPDILASFLFRVPQSLAYTWTRDGTPVAGATGNTLAASQAGAYRCTVTATNQAGSTPQASAPVTVGAAAPPAGNPNAPRPPAPPVAKATLTIVKVDGRKLYVRISSPGRVLVKGPRKQLRTSSRKGGPGELSVRLIVTPRVRNALRRGTAVAVPLTVRFVPASGTPVVKRRTVVLQTL